MELLRIEQNQQNGIHETAEARDVKFIEANTQPMTLSEIRNQHIIPVFVKDNQPTISQADFIQVAMDVAEGLFSQPSSNLALRVSHPIKGRIFQARNKKASELLEHEKTIYYERMAFAFEIPSFREFVHGQEMTLSVVGVKSYNQDNLNCNSNGLQRFKVGIGFKVKVCTNLCLFTDGTSLELKARNLDDLSEQVYELIAQYHADAHLEALNNFGNYSLTERQFATLIGKARLYGHLPKNLKKEIPELIVSDSQVSAMAREYYNDESFRVSPDGSINLWKMYNLLTGSVKSSYIDSFMDRNVNAFHFTEGIAQALENEGAYGWFLN